MRGGRYTWSTKGLSDALDHLAQIDVRLNKRGDDNEDSSGKRQKLDDDSIYDSDDEDILPPTQSLIGTDKEMLLQYPAAILNHSIIRLLLLVIYMNQRCEELCKN